MQSVSLRRWSDAIGNAVASGKNAHKRVPSAAFDRLNDADVTRAVAIVVAKKEEIVRLRNGIDDAVAAGEYCRNVVPSAAADHLPVGNVAGTVRLSSPKNCT